MSGKNTLQHSKQIVESVYSILDNTGIYKSVNKIRDTASSLVQSVSSSIDKTEKEITSTDESTNDDKSQPSRDKRKKSEDRKDVSSKMEEEAKTEPSYYTSYILPIMSKFSAASEQLAPNKHIRETQQPSSDTTSHVTADTYAKFDQAMRESRAAALVSQVVKSKDDNGTAEYKKSPIKLGPSSISMKLQSTVAIDTRTRGLCIGFKTAKSSASKCVRLEELCAHLRQYPDTRSAAVKLNVTNLILRTRHESKSKSLEAVCNEVLSHLGYVPPLKRKGISILSIDGGGSRGVVSVELLREIEKQTKQRIPDLFDFVAGTSTGALVAILLCVFRLDIDECEQLYKQVSQEVFARSLWGTGRLMWSHAYYDSNILTKFFRNNMGEKFMIECGRDSRCPKMVVVSTAVNQGRLCPYIFRTYNLPVRVQSHYQGTSQYKIWECLMASCAAPGYFQDYKLGSYILQDGGILTNNPTAVALHEAMLMWPGQPIQCVVSVGNGRYEDMETQDSISLKAKLTKIVDSATDTEQVHTVLHDLLPPATYFRLNPYMTDDITIDEQRPEKLEQLQTDAHMYVRRNETKFKSLSERLLCAKPKHIKLLEHLQVFTSKWS